MALTLSSLFIMATGLPTSSTDWRMRSSSRSVTLRVMRSGSFCWVSLGEINSPRARSNMVRAEISKLMQKMAATSPLSSRM